MAGLWPCYFFASSSIFPTVFAAVHPAESIATRNSLCDNYNIIQLMEGSHAGGWMGLGHWRSLILIAAGIAILILGGIQLWRQMFKPPGGAAHTLGAGAFPVNLADLTKLIEAIIKMPQWLLAILAGDVQIYLGYWLATGTRWF